MSACPRKATLLILPRSTCWSRHAPALDWYPAGGADFVAIIIFAGTVAGTFVPLCRIRNALCRPGLSTLATASASGAAAAGAGTILARFPHGSAR
jgi:hypothetical protein